MGAAELGEQLRVWEESGCERHISAALRRVYQLLASQVDAVTSTMQVGGVGEGAGAGVAVDTRWDATCLPLPCCHESLTAMQLPMPGVPTLAACCPTPSLLLPQLDWRRALGLHLWYGCQPTASVAEALASYTAAVEEGAAPPPLPLYAESPAGDSGASSSGGTSGGAFDVAFELLRLHAVASDLDARDDASALQPLLARLLRCEPSGLLQPLLPPWEPERLAGCI